MRAHEFGNVAAVVVMTAAPAGRVRRPRDKLTTSGCRRTRRPNDHRAPTRAAARTCTRPPGCAPRLETDYVEDRPASWIAALIVAVDAAAFFTAARARSMR